MQILADENIPLLKTVFGSLGKIRTLSGRHLSSAEIGNADILLVRSVTQVNEALLAGSQVRFVGTATIGVDHIDQAYLQQQKIGFASAPGCNATAAAEYVISALLILAEQQRFKLTDKTVGIIGCGQVGSRVLAKLRALAVECWVYDPPLQMQTDHDIAFVDWDTVLNADIITLHVPLTKTGSYPTWHMLNAEALTRLRPNTLLINAARGDVIDEAALLNRLTTHQQPQLLLDVWANEPAINLALLAHTALATPHIAGHSLEGKWRGTEMLYQAVCQYFQQPSTWQLAEALPKPPVTQLCFSDNITDAAAIQMAVLACYDPRRDDVALRAIAQAKDKRLFFDGLRKDYPVRREFNSLTVQIPAHRIILARQLNGLGFQVKLSL